MNALNNQLAKLKKDVAKKADKYSKYFSSSNQICRIKSLPDSLNLKDALGIGRKVFSPEYLTISNFASLTVHFYWKDGLLHVHQTHTNNYASNSHESNVSFSTVAEVDTWLKEIKYFIMQKCGWSAIKYRQFMASTYSFILDNLNKRDEYIHSLGDSLSIKDMIHSQSESNPFTTEIKVSRKCQNINFVSAWRFSEMDNQGAKSEEEMVFMYRSTLLPVIRFGVIADNQGKILKANIYDPLAIVANKNIALDVVKENLLKVIDKDIHAVLAYKNDYEQFKLLATA